jgi:hypothetical protein
VQVTQGDFDAEFRLAKQIEQQRVRVRTMLEQARDLKGRLARLKGQPRVDALSAQITDLSGAGGQVSGSAAPTTLSGISEWLDKLATAVDGADAAPTPDDLQGFATVTAALNAIAPRWNAFKASVQSQLPPV